MRETVRVSLKNYRCFSDANPAAIEIGPGFTALVGPNNSGKSAYLKFLYEFQPLWDTFRTPGAMAELATNPNNTRGINRPRGLIDVQEVASDYTGRPLSVELQLQSEAGSETHLDSMVLGSDHKNLVSWRGELRFGPSDPRPVRAEGPNLISGAGRIVAIEPFTDLLDSLVGCLFAPAFRNVINQGTGKYYDLEVGTGLVALWNEWKTGDAREPKIAIQRITEDIRHIFGFKSLEINASANRTTLDIVVEGRPYRLNDLGAGLSQFVILFANAAIKRPTLILLDEPELNLHPSLQIDFLTSLASYTSTGMVIFATHSIGLARAVADRIFTFSPNPTGTIVTPFERTPNYAEFAGELSFSAFRELGFSHLLMVEGPSEVKTVQQFLRVLGLDHRVVVIHLGGGSTIAQGRTVELGELKRITEAVFILIDSERQSAGASLSSNRAQFMADCNSLGFRAHATDLRALENYLPEHAVRAVKGDKYRALAPFERLNEMNPAWAKAENWLIARRVTKAELLKTDIGAFLDGIAQSG